MHMSSLQEIDLGHNNLSEVDTDILAAGVNMIQVVKLYDTNLTRYSSKFYNNYMVINYFTFAGNKLRK